MGVTWLTTQEGGGKSTMAIRNFNLRRSQFMKGRQIGLNQSLKYIHPFPPLSTQFLYLPVFNSATNIYIYIYIYIYILTEKGVRRGIWPPTLSLTYAYVCVFYNLDTFWGTEKIRITSSLRNSLIFLVVWYSKKATKFPKTIFLSSGKKVGGHQVTWIHYK
jgi:hypothetical protein